MFEHDATLKILTAEQEETIHETGDADPRGDRHRREARTGAQAPRRGRAEGRRRTRLLGSRLRDGAGGEGPVVVPLAGSQPGAVADDRRTRRRAGVDERGRPAVRERPRRRSSQRHDGRPRPVHAADAGRRRPQLRADRRRGGDRPADGNAAHGHGVLGDPLHGQAVHHLRHQRPARTRRHPHGRDRARRPRGDRSRSRAHGDREPQLAADLGLPHDRRADGRGPRRTSRSW